MNEDLPIVRLAYLLLLQEYCRVDNWRDGCQGGKRSEGRNVREESSVLGGNANGMDCNDSNGCTRISIGDHIQMLISRLILPCVVLG